MSGQEDTISLRDAVKIGHQARAILEIISRSLLDQIELDTLDTKFVAECSSALDASARLMLQSIEIVDRHELRVSKKTQVSSAARGSAA